MNAGPLTIAFSLGVAAAVAHSLKARGWATTKTFFICAFFMYELKGFIDVGRSEDQMPYFMHLKLFADSGPNYGVYLILWPAIRTLASYFAVSLAEAILTRRGEKPAFWRMNALSMIFICLAAQAVEGAALWAGWWTWKPGMPVGPIHFTLVWIGWAVAFCPAFLMMFAETAKPRKMGRWAAAYIAFYYVFLTAVSMFAPYLRNPILFVWVGGALALSVLKKPALRPLRKTVQTA